MIEKIATNDVFKSLCLILQIHKDRELVISLFKDQGVEVSKAKIKSWSIATGEYKDGFRAMPESALRAFLSALIERKLISVDEDINE